jgi:hypothetical protein
MILDRARIWIEARREPFCADDLSRALQVKLYADHRRLVALLKRMANNHEIQECPTRPGYYLARRRAPGPEDRAWKAMRAAKTARARDLAELAAIPLTLAVRLLAAWAEAGAVMALAGPNPKKYRLIRDGMETPGVVRERERAEAAAKRERMNDAFDQAFAALAEARMCADASEKGKV